MSIWGLFSENKYFGNEEPDERSESGRQQNRRVEGVILNEGVKPEAVVR